MNSRFYFYSIISCVMLFFLLSEMKFYLVFESETEKKLRLILAVFASPPASQCKKFGLQFIMEHISLEIVLNGS